MSIKISQSPSQLSKCWWGYWTSSWWKLSKITSQTSLALHVILWGLDLPRCCLSLDQLYQLKIATGKGKLIFQLYYLVICLSDVPFIFHNSCKTLPPTQISCHKFLRLYMVKRWKKKEPNSNNLRKMSYTPYPKNLKRMFPQRERESLFIYLVSPAPLFYWQAL